MTAKCCLDHQAELSVRRPFVFLFVLNSLAVFRHQDLLLTLLEVMVSAFLMAIVMGMLFSFEFLKKPQHPVPSELEAVVPPGSAGDDEGRKRVNKRLKFFELCGVGIGLPLAATSP